MTRAWAFPVVALLCAAAAPAGCRRQPPGAITFLDFGEVGVGDDRHLSVSLVLQQATTNTPADVRLRGHVKDFTARPATCDPGRPCRVDLTFHPIQSGSRQAEMLVGDVQIPLGGTGVAALTLEALRPGRPHADLAARDADRSQELGGVFGDRAVAVSALASVAFVLLLTLLVSSWWEIRRLSMAAPRMMLRLSPAIETLSSIQARTVSLEHELRKQSHAIRDAVGRSFHARADDILPQRAASRSRTVSAEWDEAPLPVLAGPSASPALKTDRPHWSGEEPAARSDDLAVNAYCTGTMTLDELTKWTSDRGNRWGSLVSREGALVLQESAAVSKLVAFECPGRPDEFMVVLPADTIWDVLFLQFFDMTGQGRPGARIFATAPAHIRVRGSEVVETVNKGAMGMA